MRDLAKRGTPSLQEQHYTTIQQHILDPENTPLPEKLRPQFARVVSAAKLLDDYPNDAHIMKLMRTKYNVADVTLRHDIQLAKKLFCTKHSFDWDFWFAWQIKDQVKLIREARLRGDLKAWNNAKKVLHDIIGPKPEAVEDPRRVERNKFVIKMVVNGNEVEVDLSQMQSMPMDFRQYMLKELLYKQAEDADIEEIMES